MQHKVVGVLSFASSLSASEFAASEERLLALRTSLAESLNVQLGLGTPGARLLQSTGVPVEAVEIRQVSQGAGSTIQASFAVLAGGAGAPSGIDSTGSVSQALASASADGSLEARMRAQQALAGVVTGGVVVSDLQLETALAPSASPLAPAPITTDTSANVALIVVLGVIGGIVVVAAVAAATWRFMRSRQTHVSPAPDADAEQPPHGEATTFTRVTDWT